MKKYLERYVDCSDRVNGGYIHFGHYNEEMFLPLVQVGWHRTSKKYGYGPLVRDHWLLHFIKKGTGIVQVEDMEYHVGESQIFAIRPHQITYYESSEEEPWEYYYVGFSGKWAEQVMKDIGFIREDSIVIQIQNPDAVFALFSKLKGYIRSYQKDGNGALGICGCVYEVLQILSERSGNECTVSEGIRKENLLRNGYTEMLISIIDNSFTEKISIQALADRLHLNRSYMSELFTKNTGMSIQSYIIDKRMQWAALLLQNPEGSISSIALACGYSDSLYFSRAFHQKFGVSPTKYRDEIRKKVK